MTLNPSSNYTIVGADSNTVAIFDVGGDSKWINVFRRVDPVGNTLNEGGDKGRFVVSRYFSYPTSQPPETIPPPPPFPNFALGGTARAGLDYTATKQATTVVLSPPGSSMVYIDGYEVEIAPLADSVYDNGEWVDFALIPNEQIIVPVAEGSTPSFVTLPISDAGTPPQPVISITAPDPNSSELATSSGMYRIMRNDVNLPQTLTINYAFDPTGLTDPATFYDDYTITSSAGGLASSGSLTFPAGVAMIEVKLTPVDDSKLENDELAQLILLSGSAYVVDAAKSKALILIVDKEEKPQIVITDKNAVEAAELKVAKWHDAFQATVDGKNVEIKGPTTGTNYDFIDRDDDRFNVWVKDLAKWQQMDTNGPSNLHIKVKISTTNVAGFTAYNDDATEVDLVRYTGGGNKGDGWFWSDSQMLVSNEIDDKYDAATYLKADDTAPAGAGLLKNGYNWEISDRTHRIALDGTTKAEYTSGNISINTVKSTKAYKVLSLHVNILRETPTDFEVIAVETVQQDIAKMREIYSQVGISILPVIPQVVNPPVGVNLADGSLDEYPIAGDINGKIDMTPEEKKLLEKYRAAPINGKNPVEIYYVNDLSNKSEGEAFRSDKVPDAKYGDSVILASIHKYVVLAHEVTHALALVGHFKISAEANNTLDSVNLMVEADRSVIQGFVTDSRRLTDLQETRMREQRPNLLNEPN